jgi:hypothetical protein
MRLLGASMLLMATGVFTECERAEVILEPAAPSAEIYSAFPEFFLEKGKDGESS